MTAPTNLAAEQALLGAILANPKAYRAVEGLIEPRHFADPCHAVIYETAQGIFARGGVADAITLRVPLADKLADAGGLEYLGKLLTGVVGIMNAREYAGAIVEAWTRRELIDVADSLKERAAGELDLSGVISEALTGIETVAAPAMGHRAKTMGEAADAALEAADAVARGASRRILTGMPSIDAAIGGFEANDLVVVAGRPGSGKSSIGLQWAINLARTGGGVLAISMEMTAAALGRRALCVAANVPIRALREGQHGPHMDALLHARKELFDLPMSVEDGGRATAAEMIGMARKAQRKHGLHLVMIDHLHLSKPADADAKQGSTAAIAGVVHACKDMTKRLGCPVLLLAQLNRGSEARDDHRPQMSDLRQAGAIEEDADVVAFVHREELFISKVEPARKLSESDEQHAGRVSAWLTRKAQARGQADIIFEKVREGEPQSIRLHFDGATASFRDLRG